MDDFSGRILDGHPFTGRIGHKVHFFETTDSTNKVAFQLAVDGAEEGAIVVADTQTRGKGRLNRAWLSPPGCNLYLSIILRPNIRIDEAPQISIVSGVGVADTMLSYFPSSASLKWPNDILINGRKICGILTEMRVKGRRLDFVIAGIGLNVNMMKEHFDEHLRNTATSVLMESGKIYSRIVIMARLIDSFEKWYNVFLNDGFTPIHEFWMDHAYGIGEKIIISFKDDVIEGKLKGLDKDGTLLVEEDTGKMHKILTGDTTVLKTPKQ